MTNVYIAKTSQTHKDRPSNSPELDHKHDKAINMPKDGRWSNKQKGGKTSQELMG